MLNTQGLFDEIIKFISADLNIVHSLDKIKQWSHVISNRIANKVTHSHCIHTRTDHLEFLGERNFSFLTCWHIFITQGETEGVICTHWV